MKIAHISDIHIRNLKYHDEYRRVFDDLYRHLEAEKPDLIINTGDTAHTKTQISPEFVAMASEHLKSASSIAPYHMILGNHDLSMMNPDRQDAITPIVNSIRSDRINLHKKSGRAWTSSNADGPNCTFWVFSLADLKNYPTQADWSQFKGHVNIGLFHGSVAGCVTDLNWRMTDVEHGLDTFDGLDYTLLGDIHKRQSFRDGRIGYPGSLIQQNFGEEIEKGFLIWDIKDQERFETRFIPLKGSRKFYTIKLNADLSLPDTHVEEGSRIRISPPQQITLAQQKQVEKEIRRVYKPHDVITLSAADVGVSRVETKRSTESVENLRQIQVQERLIREFLEDKELPEKVLQRVLDLNRKYQVHVEQEDETVRNIAWRLDRIAWSNFFNYGEENYLEMAEIPGLTGIFGPNGSGKSAFIDMILETCFDSITKNVSKNISLINDNKESAQSVAYISANEQRYVIEREVNRIKYGQKKFDETREWGRTSVSFAKVDEMGGLESLTGVSRPETERAIRARLGSYEDFLLTSVSAQANPLDIISCKETKRKEILYKFFDLDIFADKGDLAKKESKEHFDRLKRLEDDGLEKIIVEFRGQIFTQQEALRERKHDLAIVEDERNDLQKEIDALRCTRPTVKVAGKASDWLDRIDEAEFEIKLHQKKLHELSFNGVDNTLKFIEEAETNFDLKLHEEKAEELFDVHVEIRKYEEMVRDHRRGVQDLEKKAATLADVPCGDKFPGCKFLVDSVFARDALPVARENLGTRERALEMTKTRLPALEKSLDRLHKHRDLISQKEMLRLQSDKLKLEFENIKLKIVALKDSQTKLTQEKVLWESAEQDRKKVEEIDAELRLMEFDREKLDDDVDAIQAEIEEMNRKLGSSQGIFEKLTCQMDELQEIRDACQAYELFIDAMGKDGIALKILVQKLPVLNEQINKILANAADFGVTVDYDPQEQTVNFFMQYGQYKSRILELAGGAEKFLASIAIRCGLLSMSNLPKTNMFIIDEGFGKLDPKNLESVQRMLEYIRTVFEHVLLISHVDSMKDIVDNIVEITADQEGYAHVAVGGKDAD